MAHRVAAAPVWNVCTHVHCSIVRTRALHLNAPHRMQKGYGTLSKQQAAKLLDFMQSCAESFLASYLHVPFTESLAALVAVACVLPPRLLAAPCRTNGAVLPTCLDLACPCHVQALHMPGSISPAHAVCRLFTGLKSASHNKVRWVVKGSASMRECLDAALGSAPCDVGVARRASTTKAACITLYNEDVIRHHDGAFVAARLSTPSRAAASSAHSVSLPVMMLDRPAQLTFASARHSSLLRGVAGLLRQWIEQANVGKGADNSGV